MTSTASHNLSSEMDVPFFITHCKFRNAKTLFRPSAVQSLMGQPCADVEKGQPPLLTWRKYFSRLMASSYLKAGDAWLTSVERIWVRSR